jgi:hypothetical protein
MQKFIIAIALALTLTCASAAYNSSNYVKGPIVAVQDSEYNYTNMTGPLTLASVTVGNLFLVSQNLSVNTGNTSANSWNIWYRQLDSKALTTAGSNLTATFAAPLAVGYYNNYAVGFSADNDSSVPQLRAYQLSLSGGAATQRLTLSSNTNASAYPTLAGAIGISKTLYIFTLYANNRVNVTSFTIGGSTLGSLEFIFSSTYDTPSLSLAWGESLGSNQVFATWVENGILKDTVVDVSKGSVNAVTVGAYAAGYQCSAFATDKKWYGDLCYVTNGTTGTINYYVRSNTTSLIPLTNSFTNTSTLGNAVPYGPYLALIYRDIVNTAGSTTWAYEIWNLDTYTIFKNRTSYLTIDTNSTVYPFRVVSGGLYTLLYNNKQQTNATLTLVQVGLVLGSSYLTTIFGSLLAIIAGLLLF